jgi:hypothetical protein
MEIRKFTFRNQPKEGGQIRQNVDIKLGGEIVGIIKAPLQNVYNGGRWVIHFSVGCNESEDDGFRPSSKWKRVETRFKDGQSARQWVKDNAATIISWGCTPVT